MRNTVRLLSSSSNHHNLCYLICYFRNHIATRMRSSIIDYSPTKAPLSTSALFSLYITFCVALNLLQAIVVFIRPISISKVQGQTMYCKIPLITGCKADTRPRRVASHNTYLGQDRWPANVAQLPERAPEVVSPLRHTVGLIYCYQVQAWNSQRSLMFI